MVALQLRNLIEEGIVNLKHQGVLPADAPANFEVVRPERTEHGDFSANAALSLSKAAGVPPRQLAEKLVAALPAVDLVKKVEIAGAGFINFFLSDEWLPGVVAEIVKTKSDFGRSELGRGQKIQVEFGSANPTGPITVGNARNIVFGDALASLLATAGFEVERENYQNDTGGQAERFARSLEVRYRQALGHDAEVPSDGYHGEYLVTLGRELAELEGMGLIGKLDVIEHWGLQRMIEWQANTLARIGVRHDHSSSQRELIEAGKVQAVLDRFKSENLLYEHEGAWWFKATEFGHGQDQVMIRSPEKGGSPTYLAADAAYLLSKLERGFDHVVYFWGADHHNTAGALRSIAKALGVDERVEIIIYQFVTFQGGRFSKRSGDFITLDEMVDEVGSDATRFTFLHRSPDSEIVFDFDLVKKQAPENPVFYVQYAHARICSILRYAKDQGLGLDESKTPNLSLLTHDSELLLMRKLSELSEVVESSARLRAPFRLTHYAVGVASAFSAFYRDCRVLGEDPALTLARLTLADAARQVLANTFAILGISAPESM